MQSMDRRCIPIDYDMTCKLCWRKPKWKQWRLVELKLCMNSEKKRHIYNSKISQVKPKLKHWKFES